MRLQIWDQQFLNGYLLYLNGGYVDADDLKMRIKEFSLRITKVVEALRKNWIHSVIGNQLLRSGTALGANY